MSTVCVCTANCPFPSRLQQPPPPPESASIPSSSSFFEETTSLHRELQRGGHVHGLRFGVLLRWGHYDVIYCDGRVNFNVCCPPGKKGGREDETDWGSGVVY